MKPNPLVFVIIAISALVIIAVIITIGVIWYRSSPKVILTGTPTPSPSPTPTPSPTGTPTPSPTPSPTGTPTPSPTGTSTGSLKNINGEWKNGNTIIGIIDANSMEIKILGIVNDVPTIITLQVTSRTSDLLTAEGESHKLRTSGTALIIVYPDLTQMTFLKVYCNPDVQNCPP